MHELFPEARLHGTQRHLDRFPELPWEEVRSEDQELHEWYSDDLDFTIPRGVDFISANENVHFASVLAYHRASGTIHVDDTLMYIRLPRLLSLVGLRDRVGFHPTLAMALEKREGAAAEFREWAAEFTEALGYMAGHGLSSASGCLVLSFLLFTSRLLQYSLSADVARGRFTDCRSMVTCCLSASFSSAN